MNISVAVVNTNNDSVFSEVEVTSTSSQNNLYFPLRRECTYLSFPFLSNITEGTAMVELAAASFQPSAVVNVAVNDCPLGFEFSASQNQCHCLPLILDNGLSCNVSDGTVIVPPQHQNWLGLVNGEVAYANNCPFGYCAAVGQIRIFELNVTSFCTNDHTGILCGRCKDGLSSTLGDSTACQVCSNLWLLVIPIFMVAGVGLVLVLFALRLTISTGTINGIIFYANMFSASSIMDFDRLAIPLRPLNVAISFLSLNLGFPLCFYSGMNELAKAWLNFAFPAYLFVIVGLIIILSKFSLKLSKLTAHASVQVLATLIFLSYASLIGAVFNITNANVIQISNGTFYVVWFQDANVPYVRDVWHAILLAFALLVYFGLILPYTIFITVAPCLYRFKIINKFRAFLDAHYGPYKDRFRFWFGVRLWMIQLIFLLNTTLRFRFFILLTVIQVFLTVFIVVESHIRPYKYKFLNWLDTALLLFFVLLVSITAVLILVQPATFIFTDIIFSLTVIPPLITFAGVLCYHVKLVSCSQCHWPQSFRRQPKAPLGPDKASTSIELECPYTAVNVHPTMENDAHWRESLLEIADNL